MTRSTGPHRDLKVKRLRDAIGMIPGFATRDPLMDDPEFSQWSKGVLQLLVDLFAHTNMLGYSGRFVRIHFRSTVRHPRRHGSVSFQSDFRSVWANGLHQAEVVLREALEEAELGPVAVAPRAILPTAHPEPPIVINVSNVVSNAFSPTINVTFTQLISELAAMPLSAAERELAKEELLAIEAETKGEQRWPVIARSLESIKAIGKGVYKDIAVPLIVEFLKHQSGLAPPKP